jgi:hypothetical protein
MYMCPIPNGFQDRAISLYSSLDLAPNIVLPSRMWIGVKRQLAVVTVANDIVGVLWKIHHIFTNAEYANMLYAVLKQVVKCIDVDSGMNFRKFITLGKLYQLYPLNNKYRYQKQYVISLSYKQFWNYTVEYLYFGNRSV